MGAILLVPIALIAFPLYYSMNIERDTWTRFLLSFLTVIGILFVVSHLFVGLNFSELYQF